MKNTGLYLIGGAALLYFISKASTITALNFVPRGLAFVGNSIRVVVGVQNPTSNSLALRSVAGSLIVNGNVFGNVSDFQPAIIGPNAETPIALIFFPSIFGITETVIQSLQDGSAAIIAELDGSANVDNNSLPFKIRF